MYKPIVIVQGEPNSILFEIFFKSLKEYKIKSPVILICSRRLLIREMNKLNFKKKINTLNHIKNLGDYKLNNKCINLINVEYYGKLSNSKNLKNVSNYIKECLDVAFKIIKSGYTNKFINGPISKKNFLKKKYLGMTEYISKKFLTKKFAMLIYNNKLSVCPLTTHVPINRVSKKITKKNIIEKVKLINEFYVKYRNIKPKIAVLGLNPHCESINKFNEDEKIITPAVKYLSKLKLKVYGPFAADTIFLSKNREKYNVILGMYHDQVLTPIKTLYEYDAINITLGLPFFRISPDHGPNISMIGKNISNPLSLIQAFKFLDKN